jgi:hypothetical protein
MSGEIRPTWFGRWVGHLIVFTPLGDSHWACGLHWWAIRRWPGLFHRTVRRAP